VNAKEVALIVAHVWPTT